VDDLNDDKETTGSDDKAVLARARKRFSAALDFESENREAAIDDLRFSEGDQWPEEIKTEREKDNRPCLVINKTSLFIRQIVNDIRQIRPSIKVRPVDSQADPDTALIIDGMIRAIEQDSSAASAYDWAAEYAVRSGVGFWRIQTEYEHAATFDQVIRIERIRNPFSVYVDPGAVRQDASDAMWMFVVDKMPKAEFETKYPDAKGEWTEGEGEDEDYWYTEDHVRVAEYWEVTEEPFTLSMVVDPMSGQQGLIEGEVPEGLQVLAERESMRRKVTQRLMTGANVLETNEWLGEHIPVVRCLGREINIEGQTILKGLTRDIKDPARQYNYFRSASTERVALYSKAPWIGRKGSFKNPKWRSANTKNYAYLEYDGDVPPQREPPPDVSTGFSNEVMVASEELKSVTGIFNPGLGDRSNEVSGVAIDSRRSESDVSNFDFVDNLARAITYTGKILVDLIPKIYSGPRAVRILKPDGEEDAVQLNQPYVDPKTQKDRNYQLDAGRYDVSVDVGPSYATQRKEANEAMLEILKAFPAAAQVLGDLVAKNFDFQGADELAKRLKLLLPPEILADENPQFKQAMQQKDQQIQQLTQQMQVLMTEAQRMSIELQNKQAEVATKQQAEQTKQADLMRKIKKDLMDHVEGMTSLELEAGRDLSQQGLGY
jgi:hypothetical protein